MHCPPDLLAWHNDQWLAMSVHDAKLYSLNPNSREQDSHFFAFRGHFGFRVFPCSGHYVIASKLALTRCLVLLWCFTGVIRCVYHSKA